MLNNIYKSQGYLVDKSYIFLYSKYSIDYLILYI